MAMSYTIKQGDYLAKIAKEHGFADWKPIWNHASNKALKDKRKDPNILFPGDQLFIPDKEEKQASVGTDDKHKFSVKRSKLKLGLALDEKFKKPISGVQYQLLVNGQVISKTTDGKGKLEAEIPPDTTEVQLIVKNADTPISDIAIPIKVGHLDPVEERSGQEQRLNNLGYFPGPYPDNAEDENDKVFRSAVEEFQCDNHLTVDGVCGPQTQAKLVQIHGC